jgi:predicted extracellular nuclease
MLFYKKNRSVVFSLKHLHTTMKRLALVLSLLSISAATFAQKKLCIAFYNQENLFDTIDDPHKNDNEFLPTAKKEWNTEKYTTKINHMATVISSMNEGKKPDVLGMCEVENKSVLQDIVLDKQLAKSKYNFVHYESPDDRSIDNALLYKSSQFKFIASAAYKVTFAENPNAKTRDILLVKLQAKNKESIVFLVNHFPSRLGGQQESEIKRFQAAKVLRHIYDSVLQSNPKQAVIIMGDFNDEPIDASIDSVLAAKGNATELKLDNDLFNTMYTLKKNGEGSYLYKKEWNMLDQLMVSKALVDCKTKLCYQAESSSIYKKEWMLETDEKHKGAPLKTFSGNKYLGGFSDHFPVYLYIQLK